MLCHDYPALGYELRGRTLPEADARASAQVQSLLAAVAQAICAQLVVHGHWHHAYVIERDGTTVAGLDCDGSAQTVVLLELDTLQTKG